MKVITEAILKSADLLSLADSLSLGNYPALINGVCDSAIPAFSAAICKKLEKKAVFVLKDEKSVNAFVPQLEAFFDTVLVLPAKNIVYEKIDTYSHEWEQERISVFGKLLYGSVDALVCVPEALMQFTIPPQKLKESSLLLTLGESRNIEDICLHLLNMGYSRAEFVEGKGQFSVRGGILDVFDPSLPQPVRIDFFGDDIDKIAFFDIFTQRCTDKIQEVRLLPARENVYDKATAARVGAYISDRLSDIKSDNASTVASLVKEKEDIDSLGLIGCPDKYHSLIYENACTAFDYFDNSVYFMVESKSVYERARAYNWEINQQIEALVNKQAVDYETAVCSLSENELLCALNDGAVVFDAFLSAGSQGRYKSYAKFSTKQNSIAGYSFDLLAEELGALISTKQSVLYIASNSVSCDNSLSLFAEKGIPCFRYAGDLKSGFVAVAVATCGRMTGFEFPAAKLCVLAEETGIKKEKRRKSGNALKGERITSYSDLSIGDYVVHINHGIGVFNGIHNLVSEGVSKDFIKISYAGGDSLYVPAGRLDAISKYIGSTDNIKLNRLGGTEWFRAKQKAKSSAKSIAKELLKLYGERQRGIAEPCVPDDELQNEFEAMFEFPETEGQLTATDEIKQDMEKAVPMERLLCGDVGFGKTEVALRAAFKAVNSGGQVAVLVPTTLLAWQHFQTMKARFKGFPVNIGMLSSFNDKRLNDENVAKLKTGRLDIVVGTHRLLQKDVAFKKLGLLIIDEEQRFGVTHKERLKTLAKSVHTLTLSATPIPRTLNMALSGIRDMSVLEDAPTDRLPVQSYVLEYDESVIFNAIERELRRGGQVFYLRNNVDVLYSTATVISERFPDKNIAVAHGQMDKEKLSEIWSDMVSGDIDILVCTTIIETGVDIPNANTLIIEDADRMGLSQLHQIRGRVGRSPRRAYAYFTYRRGKMLTEIAEKRLQAIRDYTEFGSGFKIAMRDLEIRGAGNLLGAEQHGHIESVGYDLYIKLLQEAVDEEKGTPAKVESDCTVDVKVNAYIPEDYISSSGARIDVYRKISYISSENKKIDLCDELCDRFGTIPTEVLNLIETSLIRHKAAELKFTSVEQKEGLVSLYTPVIDIKACTALSVSPDFKGRIMISAGSRPHISCRLTGGGGVLKTLSRLLTVYGEFCKNV